MLSGKVSEFILLQYAAYRLPDDSFTLALLFQGFHEIGLGTVYQVLTTYSKCNLDLKHIWSYKNTCGHLHQIDAYPLLVMA